MYLYKDTEGGGGGGGGGALFGISFIRTPIICY